MMADINQFLETINGEIHKITIGDQEKLFLKIRSYPCEEIMRRYEWGNSVEKTDEFYDTEDMQYLRNVKLYQRSDGFSFEITKDVGDPAHYYSERQVSTKEFQSLNLKLQLSYTFSRKIGQTQEYEVYYDRILSPISNEVITWKIEIPLAFDLETIRNKFLQLNQKSVTFFPVYSKVMYVLQCSNLYPLFNELYQPSLWFIEKNMKCQFSTEESVASEEAQFYIWSFMQIVHFQYLFEERCTSSKDVVPSLPEIYERLTKIQNETTINIRDKCFGLRVTNYDCMEDDEI